MTALLTTVRRVPGGAVRRRFWLAVLGATIALTLIPFSARVEGRLETAVHIRAGEAEAVDRALAERFQSPYVHRVIVVAKGLPDLDSPGGKQALGFIATSLKAEPGVAGVLSSLDWANPLFRGKGGGTLLIVGLQPHAAPVESLIPQLRTRDAWIEDRLRVQYPSAQLELTGETPLNFDLRKISAADANRAEARVLPVALILLLLAFGSLMAAMLPLCVGVLSISMTMGACALLAHFFHLSILVQNLATMLGLGLGIDYALLMVSRFREALGAGHEAGTAADIAAKQAGRTLVISAATVAIGFAALLWVPISELRSIGVAGLLVATMSLLLCTLVLPFVLGHLGARIDTANLRSLLPGREKQMGLARPMGERWRNWGTTITARPWTALLLAGTPLLLLAWQARLIAPGLPGTDWLPAAAESVQALHSLQAMGRAGIVQSLRIVLELPPATPIRSDMGWQAASRLTAHLTADARAEQVISLPELTGMGDSGSVDDLIPDATVNSLLSRDGRATLIEVLPSETVSPSQQAAWVRELRHADIASITGITGATLRIGGLPALDADYDQVVRDRLPRVMQAVIGGSLLALMVGLRSVFAACKAVFLNLLSVAAAFGALVLVFQQGHGSWLFGVSHATGSVFTIIPILSFAIVFGLSMDYEVFLVARVLEERRRGLPERAAVIEGLASTAKLITSAAAIMITVFLGFTLGNFLVLKMLGFTLAFAVLIDATIVRMVIGPALLQLAGDWNWWPFGLLHSAAVTEAEPAR